MNRVVVALAGIVVLTGGEAVRGQWEPFDPAIKKFMPKDQLEFVEKTEALADLHRTQLSRIRDAKKRGEDNEQLAAKMKDLHESLVNKLKTEGLKDWVFRCDVLLPKFQFLCGGMQPFHANFKLPKDGKASSREDTALIALKPNDVFRFSTKPDTSCKMPKNSPKTWGPFDQEVKLGSVTKVEKLGVWSLQQKKVVAEGTK
jgi:hypothetical protein